MNIQTNYEMKSVGFALPPIPQGKKAVWVGDTLKLIDAPEEPAIDSRPITEKIKTFEDACQILGENHPYVVAYNAFEDDVMASVGAEDIADVSAYLKLRIIATALNEGWKPEFTESEYRWYPWFYLYTQDEIDDMSEEKKKEISLLLWGGAADSGSFCGLGYVNSWRVFSSSSASCGSRLAVKSEELAKYFGRQFIEIWADYVFKPKQNAD